MVNVLHRFTAPRKSGIYPEASALWFLGEPGVVGLAKSVLLLGLGKRHSQLCEKYRLFAK